MKLHTFKWRKYLKNNCLCLQINFYLANMHGRGENLKANMDSRSEWQWFLPEKSVPTEFALMLWYEIDISFKKKKTLLPVFPIHTK